MKKLRAYQNYILAFITIPALLTGSFIAYKILTKNTAPKETIQTANAKPLKKTFPPIEITATGAVVYDTKNGAVLFEKNAAAAFPLASITKIMTALVAAESAPLYTLITIDRAALLEEGDTGLRPYEIWKLGDLLDLTLAVSSNDGAHAIAETIGGWQKEREDIEGREFFIELMNQKARELHLPSVKFFNETGLDKNGEEPGAVGSALDIAKLFSYTLAKYPSVLAATRKEKIELESKSRITHYASNTNEYIANFPRLIASKTGFTDLARGNLAIAFAGGPPESIRPIIIVVLGSTPENRFKDAEVLAKTAVEYLSN